MPPVLRRKDSLLGSYRPLDTQHRIVPRQAPFSLRGIKSVAFVLHDRRIAQHGETVGETARYEKLTAILRGELHGDMAPERGRSAADIYRHGVYLTGGASQVSKLAQLMSKGTGLKVNVSENPVTSVALGLAKVINDDNYKTVAYAIEGMSK